MAADLYVHCPSADCEYYQEPIRLLLANPLRAFARPGSWPSDGSWLYLACPKCRLVYAHCHAQIIEFPESSHNEFQDKIWWRIGYECAAPSCGIPVEFHALMDATVSQTTKSELYEKLHSGYWSGATPCVHPIAIAKAETVYFDFDRGRMLGYKANQGNR